MCLKSRGSKQHCPAAAEITCLDHMFKVLRLMLISAHYSHQQPNKPFDCDSTDQTSPGQVVRRFLYMSYGSKYWVYGGLFPRSTQNPTAEGSCRNRYSKVMQYPHRRSHSPLSRHMKLVTAQALRTG